MLKVLQEEGIPLFQKGLALVELVWLFAFGVIPYCGLILKHADSFLESAAMGAGGGIILFMLLTGVGSE